MMQCMCMLTQGKVQGYHSQAELQELGLDQHELLKLLKDEGAEFVYDNINDDEEDEVDGMEVDGEEGEEEELEECESCGRELS